MLVIWWALYQKTEQQRKATYLGNNRALFRGGPQIQPRRASTCSMRNYKVLRAKRTSDISRAALCHWSCPKGTLIWQQHVHRFPVRRGRGQETGSDHCRAVQKRMKVSTVEAGQRACRCVWSPQAWNGSFDFCLENTLSVACLFVFITLDRMLLL